jgi:DNA modification methylase
MLSIRKVPIGKIKPADYNPRHNLQPGDPEYEKLLKSIDEFDCVEPLVWNRRTENLIGGHQRLKILAARGDTEVMCSVVDLPLEKEKALNIALNKISGDWDEGKLATLLDELIRMPEFDFEVTGFDLPEASQLIDQLLHQNNDEDDDFDVEDELQQIVKPKTRPGELIELGPHRILCGDCTDTANIKRLMKNKKAQLVFTDPPYSVDYRGGRVGKDCEHKLRQDGVKCWDQMSVSCYQNLLTKSLHHAYQFSDEKAVLYLWFASVRIATVIDTLSAANWEMRNLLVWVKNTFAGSLFAQYKHQYEPFFYCSKKGKSTRWFGPNNESTVWRYDKPHRNEGHPTIKPLPLAIRALRNSSSRSEIVLDLFLGSGTTLIAAQRTGRVCFGTELEPRYCDLIRKRYELEHFGSPGAAK